MSNLIFACWRGPQGAFSEGDLRRVADQITPSNVTGHPHRVVMGTQEGLCLTGPVGAAAARETSAHLGAFAGSWPAWHEPGSPVPDGSFALVRSDGGRVELCSDFAGTRSLWYILTETRFLASTSQRALVSLLESLDFNRAAFAWFLSSGTLGPSDGWDRRIQRLPRNACLVLDRQRWTLDLRTTPLEFSPRPMKAAACREELLQILRAAIQRFDFTSAHWALPLSGGYDSRFILGALVEAGVRPPTITWGLASSLSQPGNDAFIARRLATHYGLTHDYLLSERSEDPPTAVVDRFLAASGGATDQLFPYLDGLCMWASFATSGISGVIRGDEGFGWIPVRTTQHARSCVGLTRLGDFLPQAEAEELADGAQRLPETLEQRAGESIPTYRDRLYHGYRIPVGLAALNDVKTPYVEIASPLLAREVLTFVREMPDDLRTDKLTFRQIAKAVGPPMPYATMGADDDRNDYLRSEAYRCWFHEELGTGTVEALLPASLRARLLGHLSETSFAPASTRTVRAALKRVIPTPWIRAVKARLGPELPSWRFLALRTALTSRLVRLLESDAKAMRDKPR